MEGYNEDGNLKERLDKVLLHAETITQEERELIMVCLDDREMFME